MVRALDPKTTTRHVSRIFQCESGLGPTSVYTSSAISKAFVQEMQRPRETSVASSFQALTRTSLGGESCLEEEISRNKPNE